MRVIRRIKIRFATIRRWAGGLRVDVKRGIDNNGYVVVSVSPVAGYTLAGWTGAAGDGG